MAGYPSHFAQQVPLSLRQSNVREYLAQFGLEALDDATWCAQHLARVKARRQPLLEIAVVGSAEAEGHTWYALQCAYWRPSVDVRRAEWRCHRRLGQLRKDLHDPVKEAFGAEAYGRHFGAAPFASSWKPSAAEGRLRGWCQALARCINLAEAPPAVAAAALRLLEAPADDKAVMAASRSCALEALSSMAGVSGGRAVVGAGALLGATERGGAAGGGRRPPRRRALSAAPAVMAAGRGGAAGAGGGGAAAAAAGEGGVAAGGEGRGAERRNAASSSSASASSPRRQPAALAGSASLAGWQSSAGSTDRAHIRGGLPPWKAEEMARSRGLVEIKELVQVFTKEMVRGKTLNAVLPGGRVVDVTCSLSRMLDTLTIQRGSEARDIPLADVEELLVGSECRGDEGGPPTSELLVAFALETGEQIIFSFPDTAARDTFAIFFHSRAECFDQPARAAAPPSAAAAPAATAAAAPSPAPAAVPAEVLRPELLGEEHREEGGGGRDWRALDGLESEDSASPAASQASPGASPKARPPPDKALVQAFTKEMVRGKRFSARLPGGCEEDVTCVLSRALDALTVQGAEAREIKLASVEGVLVGNHCNQDTSDPCCANLSVDLSLESGERFTFRFPDAAARDLFATCFQTFARAAAGAKPRDSAGPPASCGSLGVGASQELRPASPSEEVLRPGSSSEEAREGGAAPEELSPSRGGVASVGDGAEAAAEEPGAAAAAGESGGGQLLDSAAAVEEARRQADERLKQALEEAAAERAQAVEEARREALEAAQREAAAEMARLVEKARQEALQELQREAEENMAAERTEAIERAKREALEEVEREATKKAAAVAQSRRDAMRQGPCNHDTMELTPEFMDRLLAHMEEALERIEATSKPGSGSTVGLVRAELEFLSRAELARDFTNAVLRKEAPNSSGGGSRSGLFQTVFGGHGCRRISQLRAILEGAAISKANGGERRLAACTSVCESVERVLQDAGLGEAMRQALALESEARLQRARLPNAPSAAAAR